MNSGARATAASEAPLDLALHASGAFILACLVVGGGTDKGLASDLVLELLALPLVFSFIMSFPDRRVEWQVNAFTALIASVLLIQLIPTFGLSSRPFLVAIDGGRTLESAAMMVVWLAIFYRVVRLEQSDQELVLRYMLAGVALNFAFSFLQFGSRNFGISVQFLPYTAKAGFFANENHLAALFYVSVPFIIALFRRTRLPYLALPVVGAMMLFQLVVGSRAGVMLILAAVLVSYAVLLRSFGLRALLGLCVAGVGGLVLWLHGQELLILGDSALGRVIFAQKTWAAAMDHLPFGTGFGTFLLVYPRYETTPGIVAQYVNHAHNDYLELLLEAGLLAAGLIFGFLALFFWQAFRANLIGLQKASGCAMMFLLIHSAVDYPLRTMALGIVFATAAAVYFGQGPGRRRQAATE